MIAAHACEVDCRPKLTAQDRGGRWPQPVKDVGWLTEVTNAPADNEVAPAGVEARPTRTQTRVGEQIPIRTGQLHKPRLETHAGEAEDPPQEESSQQQSQLIVNPTLLTAIIAGKDKAFQLGHSC